jgi:hypothetical protein
MGNLVVSVNWQSKDTLNPQNETIRQKLIYLAEKHGLSTDIEPNNIEYIENFKSFGAGMDGMQLIMFPDWYKKQCHTFILDCQTYLNSTNTIWTIQMDNLPQFQVEKVSSVDFVASPTCFKQMVTSGDN